MLVRWLVLGLILSPLLKATHPPRFGRKMSTMLSFDLRRKTKHHRERNTTTATETPAPTTSSNEEEEMEFSLRVCLARLRARCTNLNKFNYILIAILHAWPQYILTQSSILRRYFISFYFSRTEYIVRLCY